ncbi:MAG: ATP-binding protein [Collinsella sp.]|nr:ATP-binding protein [Collinsella sp.]
MKLINRASYMDTLTSLIGVPDIKVITGIRRSGKSKLLEALRDYVEANLPNSNVIHINYNLDEFENLLEYHALLAYVKDHRVPGKQNFLLIDEVQMCDGFERAINSLHASEHYDIFITGSNAFLLSSDLSTLFTGRTFEIEVFPFSFEEYRLYGDEGEVDRDFDEYARTGGMSGSYPYPLQEQRYQYLSNVFKTLIVRDIVQRHNVRNESALLRIADYMMDNVSNITSARNITDALNADGLKITNKTVGAYMGYLCDAFASYKVRRYDIRGKKYLKSGEKYYLADHAFKYALLGTRNMDWGRVYENMVAIELLRRGYEVYVGVLYKKEIDFIAIKRSEKLYIQVSDDISSDKTFEREISPLLSIGDAYPKMILARMHHEATDRDGVQIVDLARWLCGEA